MGWEETSTTADFKAADPEKKAMIRDYYFKTRIAPKSREPGAPTEEELRAVFMKKTAWIDELVRKAKIKKKPKRPEVSKPRRIKPTREAIGAEVGVGKMYAGIGEHILSGIESLLARTGEQQQRAAELKAASAKQILEQTPRLKKAAAAGVTAAAPVRIAGVMPTEITPEGTPEEIAYSLGKIGPELPIFMATAPLGPMGGMIAGFAGIHAMEEFSDIRDKMLADIEARGKRPVPPAEPIPFTGFTDVPMAALPEAAPGLMRVAKAAVKGGMIGAATGYAGKLMKLISKEAIPALIERFTGEAAVKEILNPLLQKAVTKIGTPAAEIVAMTETGAALEGHKATLKDYAHAAMTLAAIKGGSKMVGRFQRALTDLNKRRGIHPYKAVKEITNRTTAEEFDAMTPEELINIIKTEMFEPTPMESVKRFTKQEQTQVQKMIDKPRQKLRKKAEETIAEYDKLSPITEGIFEPARKRRKIDPYKKAKQREKIEIAVTDQVNEIVRSIENFEYSPRDFFADPTAHFDPQIMGEQFGKSHVQRKIIKEIERRYRPQDVEAEVDRMIKEEAERQELEGWYEDLHETRIDTANISPEVIQKTQEIKPPKPVSDKLPFVEELKLDPVPQPGKVVPFENARFKKFLHAFERRLGTEDAMHLYANRHNMAHLIPKEGETPLIDWQKNIRNKIEKIENLSEKREILHEMAKAIRLKDDFGEYGSVTKIVKQRTKRSNLNPQVRNKIYPVYEYQEGLMKAIPKIEGLKRLTTATAMFEEMPEPIRRFILNRKNRALKDAKMENDRIKEDIKQTRKRLGIGRKSDERIGIFATLQQTGGARIIDHMGIKLKKADFELVEPTEGPLVGTGQKILKYKLTPAEQEMYLKYRTYYKNFYERLNEVRRKAGVDEFGEVENYFTFARQIQNALDQGLSPTFARPKDLYNNPFANPRTTSFGWAKKRGEGISPIDLDSYRVFSKYSKDATDHIHVSPFVAQMREVVNSKKGRFKLREENEGAYQWMTQWLNEVAGKKARTKELTSSKLDRVFEKASRNVAVAYLSFVGRSAAVQYSAFQNAVPVLGIKHSVKGLEQLLDPKMRKFAMETSDHLYIRQHDANIYRAIDSLQGRLRGKAAEVGMIPLRISDQITSMGTWLAAYSKAKEMFPGKSKEYLKDYADRFVAHSQGSAVRGDLAPIQRTAAGRALTAFQTFVVANANYLGKEVLGVRTNKKLGARERAKRVMLFTLTKSMFDSIYEDVLGLWSPNPTPVRRYIEAREDGASVPEAMVEGMFDAAGYFPIISGLEFGSGLGGAVFDSAQAMVGQVRDFDFSLGQSINFLTNPLFGIPGVRQYQVMKRGAKQDWPYDISDQRLLFNILFGAKSPKKKKRKGLEPLEIKKQEMKLPPGL